MLICKIYDKEGNEAFSTPIAHFSERISQDSETESLSCVFRVLQENVATTMDHYRDVIKIAVGKVAFFEDDTLIVEYTKYNTVNNVQLDYRVREFTGIILFTI